MLRDLYGKTLKDKYFYRQVGYLWIYKYIYIYRWNWVVPFFFLLRSDCATFSLYTYKMVVRRSGAVLHSWTRFFSHLRHPSTIFCRLRNDDATFLYTNGWAAFQVIWWRRRFLIIDLLFSRSFEKLNPQLKEWPLYQKDLWKRKLRTAKNCTILSTSFTIGGEYDLISSAKGQRVDLVFFLKICAYYILALILGLKKKIWFLLKDSLLMDPNRRSLLISGTISNRSLQLRSHIPDSENSKIDINSWFFRISSLGEKFKLTSMYFNCCIYKN